MIFLNYKCKVNNNDYVERKKEDDDFLPRELRKEGLNCTAFCDDIQRQRIDFVIHELNKTNFSVVCVFQDSISKLDKVQEYFDMLCHLLKLEVLECKREEISLRTLRRLLVQAEHEGFINNDNAYIDKYNLRIGNAVYFNEYMLDENKALSYENIKHKCEKSIVSKQLSEEIERIFTKTEDESFGVPAHYFININDYEVYEEVRDILVQSLFVNKRMLRNKYTVVDLRGINERNSLDVYELRKIFNMNDGGIVVIESYFDINVMGNKFTPEHDYIKEICDTIDYYYPNTTFIINTPLENKNQNFLYKELLSELLFVEFNDSIIYNKDAENFLLQLAEENKLSKFDGLCDVLERDKGYKAHELRKIFYNWHKEYVKTIQFPQYANLYKEVKQTEKKVELTAYDDLNSLIGLKDVKSVVDNYLNYAKLQKVCAEKGDYAGEVCRHMVFTGNPGTAKTTVARIIARVMKDNQLLSSGNLIEVGRSDIVSKYVGGTAPKVKELFKKARGNVLFIDEAYSLYDGREGLYGDEAINAIVQEMENLREDLVVIFAGYKKEMQNFLDRNSGLRSRIAFDVDFEDYDENELYDIAKFHATKMKVDISQSEEKIKEIISSAKNLKNFGNGRFIRSMLEKARMKQASRLVKENRLNAENAKILLPQDFEMPKVEEKVVMGFN